MKKIISRILLLTILLGMSFNDVAVAQKHGRPTRHSYSNRGFFDALNAVDRVAHTAMLGAHLHRIDDYTGFRVGFNAASLRTDLRNCSYDSNFTPGLNVGFVFGWHLGKTPFILEPGLYYSMKGGEIKGIYRNDNTRFTTDITMHSLEIPLVFKYELPVTSDRYVSLQPFFGGFVSFGFGGDTKIDDAAGRDKYSTYKDNLFCTTDAGLRMGIGMNVGFMYLEAAYDLGLVNLPENRYQLMDFDDFSDSMRSNTISLSIGINF